MTIDQATGEASISPNYYDYLDDGESVVLTYTFSVTDGDVVVENTLTVTVNGVDDAMIVADDVESFGESAVETGALLSGTVNVLGNDSDPDATDNPLVVQAATVDALASYGITVLGVINFATDGSYTLQLNAAGQAAAGALDDSESLTVSADYTAENQDGAVDTATLTVTVNGETDNALVTINVIAEDQVSESGLGPRNGDMLGAEATGSGEILDGIANNNDNTSETTTGTISFTADDGLRAGDGVKINSVNATIGATFVGVYGTMTITSISAGEISYSYTLTDNVDHSFGAVSDTFEVMLTDIGGDMASDTLSITIQDDAPLDFTAQSMIATNAPTTSGTGALNFYESIGADGGTVVFSGGTDGAALFLSDGTTAVTVGGGVVQLYGYGTDVLTGRIDNGDGTFTDVLQITLNPDGSVEANDTYSYEQYLALDDGSVQVVDGSDLGGNNALYRVIQNVDGTDRDLLFSASDTYDPVTGVYGPSVTVNTSANQIGVQSGPRIEGGEVLRIDFVNGATGSNANGSSPNYGYTSHYDVNGFSFGVGPQNFQTGAQMTMRIFDDSDAEPTGLTTSISDLTNDAQIQVSGILVNGVALDLTRANETGYPLTSAVEGSITVYSVIVAEGDTVQVFNEDGYNRIELQNQTDFTMGVVDLNYQIAGSGTPLEFMDLGLTATDSDGDTATGTISLNTQPAPDIVGTPDGEVLAGNSVNNVMSGEDGADQIIGNGGSDILTGGLGSDVFVFIETSDSAVGTSRDVIADFTSGSDLIDLSGIDADTSDGTDDTFLFVPNATPGTGNPGVTSNGVTWYYLDGNTIVQGDVNGDGTADFEIELSGEINLTADDFIL